MRGWIWRRPAGLANGWAAPLNSGGRSPAQFCSCSCSRSCAAGEEAENRKVCRRPADMQVFGQVRRARSKAKQTHTHTGRSMAALCSPINRGAADMRSSAGRFGLPALRPEPSRADAMREAPQLHHHHRRRHRQRRRRSIIACVCVCVLLLSPRPKARSFSPARAVTRRAGWVLAR